MNSSRSSKINIASHAYNWQCLPMDTMKSPKNVLGMLFHSNCRPWTSCYRIWGCGCLCWMRLFNSLREVPIWWFGWSRRTMILFIYRISNVRRWYVVVLRVEIRLRDAALLETHTDVRLHQYTVASSKSLAYEPKRFWYRCPHHNTTTAKPLNPRLQFSTKRLFRQAYAIMFAVALCENIEVGFSESEQCHELVFSL